MDFKNKKWVKIEYAQYTTLVCFPLALVRVDTTLSEALFNPDEWPQLYTSDVIGVEKLKKYIMNYIIQHLQEQFTHIYTIIITAKTHTPVNSI